MKCFFSRKIPLARDVLLLESGSPEVARRAVGEIQKIFPGARYHLCTCHPVSAENAFASVFRVNDYASHWERMRVLLSWRQKGWEVLAILCTGEAIMARWKWLALALLPAKVLVVNENADFFWLDWGNRKTLRRFVRMRLGVGQIELLSTVARALVFPITLLILLGTAGFLYSRRGWRLLSWRIHRLDGENPQPARPATLCRDAPKLKNQ